MKKPLFFLMITFFIACSNNDKIEEQPEIIKGPEIGTGSFTFTYYENSQLEIVNNDNNYQSWANIKAGDNLVFEYVFIFDDDPLIADDEYSETIRFEVNSEESDFLYKTEDLETIKTTLTKQCFCYFPLYNIQPTKPTGEISGKKISDNEWEITLSVVFYGNEERKFTAVYELNTLNF